jgi:micrococcal nuclease
VSWRFRKAFRPTRRYASAPRTTDRKPVSSYVTSLPKILKGPAQVVDGDTIIIKGQSIRLAGIDAPELDHPYGNNARWAMIRLCKGHEVRAEVIPGATTYERLVAVCYLPDGRDLAAELVKQGLALDWGKHSGGKYRAHETPDARQKLWRCAAKHQGRLKSL